MATKSSSPDFEKSLKSLETVVEKLESADLPLEKAVKEWEKGVALRDTCAKILSQAEQKVEVLMSADAEKEPFDGTEN
ncbi:MAG: exodeoxyribonuclease VII small subunit [Gammaproteobacteria bacterium]